MGTFGRRQRNIAKSCRRYDRYKSCSHLGRCCCTILRPHYKLAALRTIPSKDCRPCDRKQQHERHDRSKRNSGKKSDILEQHRPNDVPRKHHDSNPARCRRKRRRSADILFIQFANCSQKSRKDRHVLLVSRSQPQHRLPDTSIHNSSLNPLRTGNAEHTQFL